MPAVIETTEREQNEDPFRGLELVEAKPSPITTGISEFPFELLSKPIRLFQDLSGGCGGKTWEAANVMIDYMLWKNQQCSGKFLENKKIVEVGAGTGLVGIGVAMGCPNLDTMVITDQIPMMNLMEQNILHNNVQNNVQAQVLNWGEPIPDTIQFVPDVILASDCVYLEVAFQPLLDSLAAISNKDTDIYMSYKKRRKADKRFFQMARKLFHLTEIEEDPKRQTYNREGLRLYLMKKK